MFFGLYRSALLSVILTSDKTHPCSPATDIVMHGLGLLLRFLEVIIEEPLLRQNRHLQRAPTITTKAGCHDRSLRGKVVLERERHIGRRKHLKGEAPHQPLNSSFRLASWAFRGFFLFTSNGINLHLHVFLFWLFLEHQSSFWLSRIQSGHLLASLLNASKGGLPPHQRGNKNEDLGSDPRRFGMVIPRDILHALPGQEQHIRAHVRSRDDLKRPASHLYMSH